MTAQTASYGMDYLNHAQPKDVLRWIVSDSLFEDTDDNWKYGKTLIANTSMGILFRNEPLTIPCHQFAASVIGRLMQYIPAGEGFYELANIFSYTEFTRVFRVAYEDADEKFEGFANCPINPFHGMTMPDGSPRTSCTREEFEAWSKELDA